MRTIVIFGRKHGAKKLELITASSSGQEASAALSEFKRLSAVGTNDTHELLELWESDGGRRKQKRFITRAESERRAKEASAADAKLREAAAEKKRKDDAAKAAKPAANPPTNK